MLNERRHPIALRGVLLGIALPLLLGWLSCRPPDPVMELPRGPLLAGDAAALGRILDSLERLESTPIAREAGRARSAVAGCGTFQATLQEGAAFVEAATCADSQALAPGLEALREDAALVFVWPLGGVSGAAADGTAAPRLVGRIHVEPSGTLRVEAQLEALPESRWWRLLLPADEPAGALRLATADALVQGRFRPRAGLDLASLVSAGSQADQMFRLKSELFVGAALGDAWEFAIYMPQPGRAMPPMAIALDVARASLADQAARAFVREIESTWPLRSRPAQWPSGAKGACFDELRIMPEFAPCYALTDRSLVFAWNARAIELAISESALAAGGSEQPSRLVAHLDRFSEADARLQHAATAGDEARAGSTLASVSLPPGPSLPAHAATAAHYPFSKLTLKARPGSASTLLFVELLAAGPQ